MSTRSTSADSTLSGSRFVNQQLPATRGVRCYRNGARGMASLGTRHVPVMSRRMTLHRGQWGREQSVRSLQIKSSASSAYQGCLHT